MYALALPDLDSELITVRTKITRQLVNLQNSKDSTTYNLGWYVHTYPGSRYLRKLR